LRLRKRILDATARKRAVVIAAPKGHVRARPQPFTVNSKQTVHVDMSIDTGIR
jgi:hypothetical protein